MGFMDGVKENITMIIKIVDDECVKYMICQIYIEKKEEIIMDYIEYLIDGLEEDGYEYEVQENSDEAVVILDYSQASRHIQLENLSGKRH